MYIYILYKCTFFVGFFPFPVECFRIKSYDRRIFYIISYTATVVFTTVVITTTAANAAYFCIPTHTYIYTIDLIYPSITTRSTLRV